MSKGQSKYRNQVPNWISFEIEIDRLHETGKIIPNRSKSRVGNAWLCLIALMAKCYVIFHASRIMEWLWITILNNHTLPSTYSDLLQTFSRHFPYVFPYFLDQESWMGLFSGSSFRTSRTVRRTKSWCLRTLSLENSTSWTELRKKWSHGKTMKNKHLTVFVIITYKHI